MNAPARRADRPQGPLRRRGLAVLPDHRAQRRDHPRHHRRRARQPVLWSTRAPISARSTRRWPRATTAASSSRRSSGSCARGSIPTQRVYVPSHAGRRHRRRSRADADDADRLRSRRSAARSAGRWPASSAGRSDAEKVDRAPRRAWSSRAGGAANLGFGISATGAAHPARGRPARRGDLGDRAGRGRRHAAARTSRSAAPPMPTRSCRRRYQFTYFQGGGFDVSLLSFLQIDSDGSVNVSRLAAKPHVTAGCGGFVDITAHARKSCSRGFFRAGGLELDVGDGRLTIRREGKVPEVRARGRARHLLRRRGARAGPGRHLCHRALRASGCCRRA